MLEKQTGKHSWVWGTTPPLRRRSVVLSFGVANHRLGWQRLKISPKPRALSLRNGFQFDSFLEEHKSAVMSGVYEKANNSIGFMIWRLPKKDIQIVKSQRIIRDE